MELFLSSIVYLGLSAGIGWAADNLPSVGRVAVVAGAVQYHANGGDWTTALVNEPVADGVGLRTAADSETELRSPGARLALAPSSELQILRFDESTLQIALSSGRIGIHLGAGGPAKTIEIDLPQGGIWLDVPGDYDVTAGDAHTAETVQVFAGGVQFGGGLDASRIATATGDWFSDWWRSQNDNADLTTAPSPALTGAATLAANGRWERDAKLGNVWFPSDMASDWAPYRNGAWRYLPPWGWTWIDNEPWGFAPSHYGRWAQFDGRWGWIPGDHVTEVEYSPAEVAFLGTAGYGMSRPGDIGTPPAVAWFPLGPGETLRDGQEASYANRRFATAMPRTSFAAGIPVAAAAVDDLPEQRFLDAPVILGALNIQPPGALPVVAAGQPTVAAVDAASEAVAAPETAEHQPFFVALRDAPLRVIRDIPRKLKVAAIVLRTRFTAHPPVSVRPLVSAYHSPHNRRHLAALRGGA
ncbi:MAG TPA: DUF6600 domain-containing protein [Stellaceae bacterium]|nr:DUF6600 domain-containing protein [Stellaceae bacterium]